MHSRTPRFLLFTTINTANPAERGKFDVPDLTLKLT